MFLGEKWYLCRLKEADKNPDPVKGLVYPYYRICF